MDAESRDFLTIAFQEYWDTNRADEPTKYFTLREAMQALREYTRLSQYDLAAHLGVTLSFLNMIEAGNRTVSQYHFGILKNIARSYSLPVLLDFFDSCEGAAALRAPARGRKTRNGVTGGGNLSDWRDMMGE